MVSVPAAQAMPAADGSQNWKNPPGVSPARFAVAESQGSGVVADRPTVRMVVLAGSAQNAIPLTFTNTTDPAVPLAGVGERSSCSFAAPASVRMSCQKRLI